MFVPWISCPLSISYTSGRIFFKLWSNVYLCETMCRINNSTMPTQGQGHSSMSWAWVLNFVSTLYLLYLRGIFPKFWSNVHLWDDVQNPYLSHRDSRTRLQLKVASLSPEFRVHSIPPLPLEGFSFNFGQMLASVKRCAKPIAQPCRLTRSQFKVTGFSLEFCVHSISPWEDFL